MRNERRLARRAAVGDSDAFATIFRHYQQDLYRYCVAILGDPQDAQDALQNTMVKALAVLPGERRQIELRPWLYRVAHNESIELRRRRRPSEPLAEDFPAPGMSLDQTAADRGRLRGLLTDIGELPERQRGALVMRELAGLDFDEIGTALRTSPGAARQVLYEARLSLRQMSEGREMDCDAITAILSEKDGRVIRRRDIRAHLRDCADCRLFGEAIRTRTHLLAGISPLPAVAATAIAKGALSGAAGGGAATGAPTAGGAAAGGAVAKAASTGAILKSAAGVVAIVAVGAVTVDHGGLFHHGAPPAEKVRGRTAVAADPSADPPVAAVAADGGRAAEVAARPRPGLAEAPDRRVARADPGRPRLVPARPVAGPGGRAHGPSGAAAQPTGTVEATPAVGGPPHPEHHAQARHPAAHGHPSPPSKHPHGTAPAAPSHPPHPEHPIHPEHPVHPEQPAHQGGGPDPGHASRPSSAGGSDAGQGAHPAHPQHPSTPSTAEAGVTGPPEAEAIVEPGEGTAEGGTGKAAAPGQVAKGY